MILEKPRMTAAASLMVLLLRSPAAFADNIVINATNFSASHNILLTSISANPAGYLQGLDYTNEWVEYTFSPTDSSTNMTQIYVRGTLGADFHLQMTVTEDGTFNIQTFDFHFTGVGFS